MKLSFPRRRESIDLDSRLRGSDKRGDHDYDDVEFTKIGNAQRAASI